MRTTVTLDPDTERLVRNLMREQGISFKHALNEAIRAGLSPAKSAGARKFTQKTYSLGAEQSFRWDKALTTSEVMNDKVLIRKFALRK